jgi:hypothetical protein
MPWHSSQCVLLVLTPGGAIFASYPPEPGASDADERSRQEQVEMCARAVDGLVTAVPILADFRSPIPHGQRGGA